MTHLVISWLRFEPKLDGNSVTLAAQALAPAVKDRVHEGRVETPGNRPVRYGEPPVNKPSARFVLTAEFGRA